MKIVIVGPGAMGCLFGHFLARAGHELILLDHRPERARLLQEQGLLVETAAGTLRTPVQVAAQPQAAGIAELCMVAVKAYATRAAAEYSLPVVGPDTQVLSLQNGLGNVEALAEVIAPGRVLGGTTAQGANVVAPGHVRHAGVGETVIGELQGAGGRAAAVAGIFSDAGLPARTTTDLPGLIWSKVIINIGINALTALTRLPNGKLLDYPGTREVMAAAVLEAAAVARALGINLLYPNPVERVEAVAKATGENISSMLQDARAKRRTEVEQIQGAVVERARALGVATPVNETLLRLVGTLQESYSEQLIP
jgi:2-dehydropantoate 2-reductase